MPNSAQLSGPMKMPNSISAEGEEAFVRLDSEGLEGESFTKFSGRSSVDDNGFSHCFHWRSTLSSISTLVHDPNY